MNQIIMTRSGTAGSGTGVAGMRAAPRRDAPIGIEIRLLSACADDFRVTLTREHVWMPDIPAMTPERVRVKKNGVSFEYSF